MEVYIDDEAKLTLHGLQQHYVKLKDSEKNRKLFELLDVLEFNQVRLQLLLTYLWMELDSELWIRIRINLSSWRVQMTNGNKKKVKNFNVLKCWMFFIEG
jgi:hypothetical protein